MGHWDSESVNRGFEADGSGASTSKIVEEPSHDRLLDFMEEWEALYRRGEEVPPGWPGLSDPVLRENLRLRIEDQERLYALMGFARTSREEGIEAEDQLPSYPNHEVLMEIGRGGMGVVYKARDLKLGRFVAIKTISEGRYAAREHRERFRSEAHAVARLRHPNIIAIHAVGEHQNRPFLSLEFAEGGSLAQRLAEKPMAPREAAELVETIARAVHVAHMAGIVHRDLKPSNILLTADGIPKVCDFGLAKLMDSDLGATVSGQILGTPSYMSPEQADGHSKQVGPAADIYAIGAILYQALTGRPPFLGESKLETLKLVSCTEVVPPRRLRPDVPRDLETICLKCLEKESRKRYASAEAIGADLRRFLEDRSILARPVGPAGRLKRWSRRNMLLASVSAALVIIVSLSTPAMMVLWLRARGERDRAETHLTRAERARDQAVSAINAIVLTDRDPMLTEELRPYREMLVNEGLRLSDAMLREPESDSRGKQLHAEALMMKAKLLAEKGDHVNAYGYGTRAIELLEGLLAQNRAATHDRAAVAQFLNQFAPIVIDRGRARSISARSNEIYKVLLRENPKSEEATFWSGQIALNLHNIGHNYFEEKETASGQVRVDLLKLAIEAFQEGQNFCEEQMKGGDQPDRFLFPLATNERYLCRSHRFISSRTNDPVERAANLEKAVEYGLKAISHFQILAERNPENYQQSMELHTSQRELGELFINAQQGNAAEAAIPYYNQARATLKTIAAKHGKLVSRMADIQEALAMVDHNLSMAYDNSDPSRYFSGPRREIATEVYQIGDKLSLVRPLSRNLRKAYAYACLDMVNYQELDGEKPELALLIKAERLWAEILHEESTSNEARGMLVGVQRGLADELDSRGRSEDAMRWRGQSLTTAQQNPSLLYELATVYALNASFVYKCPGKLDIRQLEARRTRYLDEAVIMLKESVAHGFKDVDRFRKQLEFDSFRSNPAFQAIAYDLQFPADPFVKE